MQQTPTMPYADPPNTQPTPGPGPGASAPQRPVRRQKRAWQSAASTILILVAAPLIAVVLTSSVFQSYEVDGDSMETTLQNQDRLIVWKVPRTIARLNDHAYIPLRGDIVIFVKRGIAEGVGIRDKQLIKRVIARPGERVVVSNGAITVYNKEHPDGFNPDTSGTYKIQQTTMGDVDIVVPEGEVFVCGDNRGNSLDSRTFGPVPADDIVGKLTFRIFPFNKAKSF